MSAIRLLSTLCAVGGLCVCAGGEAHHSRALYDTTQDVVIEGTVTKLEWRNPHVSMTVESKDAEGAPVPAAAARRQELSASTCARATELCCR